MPPFVPGLTLCRLFYEQAVRPLLAAEFPGLPHTAARIGQGSDVLGFDTARSTDHDWGPRLELFLHPADVATHAGAVTAMLARRLPTTFHGWSTHFEPPDARVRWLAPTDGPVAHRVRVTDAGTWLTELLGFDPRAGVDTVHWLSTPTQVLAEVTGGAVFGDHDGELTTARERLRWYPDDVWRWVLAAQWDRIGEEEPFVGRAAEAGDDLGSRVTAARLARDVMRLCLLLARRYPPYQKWLGTAVGRVPRAAAVVAALGEAVDARDPDRRQAALCTAYEAAGRWQNSLGLADPVEATRRPFHDRPFPVVDAGRFAVALRARVTDPVVAALPATSGAIDQIVDHVGTLGTPRLCREFMAVAIDRRR